MVINTQYGFVFIHIPKTAGTSVMKALANLPGNNRRWLAEKTKHETWRQFRRNVRSRMKKAERAGHRATDDFYRFAFVRNPWDRMASFYRYLREMRPRAEIDTVSSFKDFLIQSQAGVKWIGNLHGMRQQVDYFTNRSGLMRLDYLGHFEFLNDDFNEIASKIGISARLPRLNVSSNAKSNYMEDFDDEMISIVGELFPDDIHEFGYEFGGNLPARRCSGPINRSLNSKS